MNFCEPKIISENNGLNIASQIMHKRPLIIAKRRRETTISAIFLKLLLHSAIFRVALYAAPPPQAVLAKLFNEIKSPNSPMPEVPNKTAVILFLNIVRNIFRNAEMPIMDAALKICLYDCGVPILPSHNTFYETFLPITRFQQSIPTISKREYFQESDMPQSNIYHPTAVFWK